MLRFYCLTEALAFIEGNLENPLLPEQIAEGCYCSLSTLQKTFRYALRMGVMDYVARRRLTMAAKDLLSGRERVVDIAYRYQYQSPEVFVRAFRRLWGDAPTAFRRKWKFSGLFPRVEGIIEGGDGMTRKKVDISELYDVLRGMDGTYVLCFDIVGLTPMNDIDSEVGDLAIVESLRRIDAAADDAMLLFRIGGDEFALVTGLSDPARTEAAARRVLDQNGQAIRWNRREIPLSLRACGVRIRTDALRYADLYQTLDSAARQPAKEGAELLMMP